MPQQQVLTKRGMASLQGCNRGRTTIKDLVNTSPGQRFCSRHWAVHARALHWSRWVSWCRFHPPWPEIGWIENCMLVLVTHHEVEHTLICNGIAKNPNLILASINRIQSNSIDTWYASHLSLCPSLSVFPLICLPVWLGCMQAAATMTCSDYRRQLLCILWILNTDIVHTDMYGYGSLWRLWVQ